MGDGLHKEPFWENFKELSIMTIYIGVGCTHLWIRHFQLADMPISEMVNEQHWSVIGIKYVLY